MSENAMNFYCFYCCRPVVHLDFNSELTESGYYLISACKGEFYLMFTKNIFRNSQKFPI